LPSRAAKQRARAIADYAADTLRGARRIFG
jgi:hypothetical protein